MVKQILQKHYLKVGNQRNFLLIHIYYKGCNQLLNIYQQQMKKIIDNNQHKDYKSFQIQELKNVLLHQFKQDQIYQKYLKNVFRVRQLNFLKILTKEILHINKPEILENIAQYLLDENKIVQQSCFELTIQLIQQMTLQEENSQLDIYLKQTTNKDTELQGKQALMAMIMAYPRYTYIWINQTLKVVLEKQNKLQQQQKTFAANYLKLYRANQLMEIEDVQIYIEFIEK